jgi:hypothetical protein
MKVGDLVRHVSGARIGFVERIDVDYYGANQALKVLGELPVGQLIHARMVNGVAPTKDGIRDRVLVCWTDGYPEYWEPKDLEVISEDR